MKLTSKKEIIPIAIIVFMFVAAVVFYMSSCLPDRIPTHWNVKGEVDAWSSKNFAVFFFPGITLALYLLLTFIPFIDPLRKNYQKFVRPYFALRLLFVVFFALLYFYTLLAALGLKLNIKFFIIPFLSLIFVALGAFLPKFKRNWFVGIRTPWTLQSDEVWEKTHKFGSKVFVLMGILSAFSVLAGSYAFWMFLIVILAGALLPAVYSYFLYRKLGLFKNNSV